MTQSTKLSFQPLYEQVKKSILERIIQGEWTPGSFLPNELALAEEYGVSQGTLRKALNSLTRENILIRYQGKGTAVAVLDENRSLFPFFLFRDRQGKRVYPVSQINGIKEDKPTPGEQKALQLGPDDPVIRIERTRILERQPVINETVTINISIFPDIVKDLDTMPNTLYEYYQLHYGVIVAHATEQIDPVVANALDMERLGISEKKPLLQLTRISYDLEDRPLEYRISHVDVSRNFIYQTDLR